MLFVETHDLPMLDVAVDFPAGISRDTREKSGLAALTLRMLRLGAEGLDEDQIAERLADVGADIGGRFDMDRAGYGLRTLSSARERDEAWQCCYAFCKSRLSRSRFSNARRNGCWPR